MSHSTHFAQSTHPSTIPGQTLATYHWQSPTTPVAAVFLLHGFRAHTRFNFLRNDSPSSLHNYDGPSSSLIHHLNQKSISVHGHDHIGHGDSTGLRAYFPSFQSLVDDFLSNVNRTNLFYEYTQKNIPIFIIGHSLGGTVAIAAMRKAPQLFKGACLSSAASEPPAGMFGLVGKLQAALSGITSTLIPTVELVAVPTGNDEELTKLFRSDPLNCSDVKIRARVGREFLMAYKDINARVHEIKTPFLTVAGEFDTLVNPQAAQRFYEGASSTDKQVKVAKGRWHNLLVEKGKEEIWLWFSEWIQQRV